jgi:hypothetical protein
MSASVQGGIAGFGTVGLGGKAGFLAGRLESIFKNNLTKATAEAAAREKLGQIVARKASGVPFDHQTKYNDARRGATAAIDTLKGLMNSPHLSDRERAFVQYLLSRYSKALDAIEKVYNSTLQGRTPPPT